ncbi:hypothetical protein F4554_005567 [Actinopolymorpha rutila]|uniref:Uncharacterized protein n=1 Tax=Actinopolymorpha rutila TaxID=446787 RepID=A0A852ZUB8_9ACTN|nr:hypothetical protein [Actinopolymorpha rutila]
MSATVTLMIRSWPSRRDVTTQPGERPQIVTGRTQPDRSGLNRRHSAQAGWLVDGSHGNLRPAASTGEVSLLVERGTTAPVVSIAEAGQVTPGHSGPTICTRSQPLGR